MQNILQIMRNAYSNLVDKLTEESMKFNVNMDMLIRNFKEGLMACKSFCCYQNYQKRLMKT